MSSLKDANVKCPRCGYIAGVYIDPDKTIVRCLSCRHDARSEDWLKKQEADPGSHAQVRSQEF